MSRVYNFSAGPAVLPVPVLEEVAANLVDYHGQWMSLLEMSHRGATFTGIIEETRALLRELLAVPATHAILCLKGGGHLQVSQVRPKLLGGAG